MQSLEFVWERLTQAVPMKPKKGGTSDAETKSFSLIELLIVVAIILIHRRDRDSELCCAPAWRPTSHPGGPSAPSIPG